jgi:hypothetical protein
MAIGDEIIAIGNVCLRMPLLVTNKIENFGIKVVEEF